MKKIFKEMTKFTTTIIGSGSAKPNPGNLSSAQILTYNGLVWLIDCCDGTCNELYRMGISINKIERIFITHAHGDHCLGLPCLIATMALDGRKSPLTVYAPREVYDIMTPVIDAMAGDKGHLPFDVQYEEVSCCDISIIYADKQLNVQAVPLRHGAHETYGYVFNEQPKRRHINMNAMAKYGISCGAYEWVRDHDWEMDDGTIIPNSKLTSDPEPVRSYAYISDTYRFKELAFMLNGVTTLYCEASFKADDRELATKWQHCTSADAAMIARDAETVKYLIIGHISARYKNVSELVKESQEIFPATAYADKNRTFDII